MERPRIRTGGSAARGRAVRQLATNGFVLATACIGLVAVLELVVFRLILPASDWPSLAEGTAVPQYVPDQSGIYRIRNEIATRYRINASGWSSHRAAYLPRWTQTTPTTARSDKPRRVAVIGDSYVEAFQVDPKESISARLERHLEGAEVYAFGLSGAPLSHHVNVLEEEVARYRPDDVVVVLVHNDLGDSIARPGDSKQRTLFQRLAFGDDGSITPIAPRPYKRSPFATLRARSATWRYLVLRRQTNLSRIVSRLTGAASADHARYAGNVDVAALRENGVLYERVARHGITALAESARRLNARLLVVMDGDRHAIRAGRASERTPAIEISDIVAAAAKASGVPYLDLHDAFARDHAARRDPLAFPHDNPWNALAHDVAARAVASALATDPPSRVASTR